MLAGIPLNEHKDWLGEDEITSLSDTVSTMLVKRAAEYEKLMEFKQHDDSIEHVAQEFAEICLEAAKEKNSK